MPSLHSLPLGEGICCEDCANGVLCGQVKCHLYYLLSGSLIVRQSIVSCKLQQVLQGKEATHYNHITKSRHYHMMLMYINELPVQEI